LALHGWGRDHHDFDAVLAGVDALALDLPGHGVAPEPPAPWSTSEYAQWVLPVLDDLRQGPVVVVGHSFGARVAVQMAAAQMAAAQIATVQIATVQIATVQPANLQPAASRAAQAAPSPAPAGPEPPRGAWIGALVLVGAPLAPAPGEPAARLAWPYRAGRFLHRAGLVPEGRMEALRQKYGSEDYRRASPVMRGVLVNSVAETASAAYIPAVRDWVTAGGALELIWGERDTVAPREGALRLLDDLVSTAAIGLTVVPAAPHLMTPPVAERLRAALGRHHGLVTGTTGPGTTGPGTTGQAPAPAP
jgi:pimeloyl-ACP methyl ester carboxylesterase